MGKVSQKSHWVGSVISTQLAFNLMTRIAWRAGEQHLKNCFSPHGGWMGGRASDGTGLAGWLAGGESVYLFLTVVQFLFCLLVRLGAFLFRFVVA